MIVRACYILLHILFNLFYNIQCDLSLTILHTNDIRSRLMQVKFDAAYCLQIGDAAKNCVGSLLKLEKLVSEHRRLASQGEIPHVLYFDTGNIYTGTYWFSFFGGEICSKMMNLMKPDVMTLGQHEFDQGISGLEPFIRSTVAPIVVTNLDIKDVQSLHPIKKSHIINVDKLKIGVVGYITPDTRLVNDIGHVTISSEIDALKTETELLKKSGVHIIIALGNSGYEMDKRVAEEVPLVDMVIGGGIRTFLYNGQPHKLEYMKPDDVYPKMIQQSTGKLIPVVTTVGFTKYLGRLNITIDNTYNISSCEGQPILISNDLPDSKSVLDLIIEFDPQATTKTLEIVGSTRVLLDQSGGNCFYGECNFGNMVTDAIVDYAANIFPSKYWSTVPIAFINGGTMTESITTGNGLPNLTIFYMDILQTSPTAPGIFTFSLSGSDLKETLEHSVVNFPNGLTGEFLQVSGLQVIYKIDNDTLKAKLHSAKARCGLCSVPVYEDIVDDQVYNISSTSYLLTGGDGYDILKSKAFNVLELNLAEVDILINYVKKMSPLINELEDRILFISDDEAVCTKCSIMSLIFVLSLLFLN